MKASAANCLKSTIVTFLPQPTFWKPAYWATTARPTHLHEFAPLQRHCQAEKGIIPLQYRIVHERAGTDKRNLLQRYLPGGAGKRGRQKQKPPRTRPRESTLPYSFHLPFTEVQNPSSATTSFRRIDSHTLPPASAHFCACPSGDTLCVSCSSSRKRSRSGRHATYGRETSPSPPKISVHLLVISRETRYPQPRNERHQL
ncbi:hypothetical protein F4823DRAFT_302832 [Ustulina deusta]|nr:hypothetical protein F4823DRAFT_302832 [Ustulina deusta]